MAEGEVRPGWAARSVTELGRSYFGERGWFGEQSDLVQLGVFLAEVILTGADRIAQAIHAPDLVDD